MNTKQLFVAMALIGVCLIGTTPAGAATISFSEDPNGIAPIAVTTDIGGATTTSSIESASLSLGNVTGPSTLLFRRQMTNQGTMTGEGGGGGVSDVLSLFSFVAGGATVGFQATFQSDAATGISPPPGNFPAGVTNLLEDGNLQLLTPAGFSVTLPGLGLVSLAVNAQSDAVEGVEGQVPLPGALPLFATGLGALGLLGWRRKKKAVALAA
jgi:hypothetical protein